MKMYITSETEDFLDAIEEAFENLPIYGNHR